MKRIDIETWDFKEHYLFFAGPITPITTSALIWTSHVFVDGDHMGQYFDTLQKMLQEIITQ